MGPPLGAARPRRVLGFQTLRSSRRHLVIPLLREQADPRRPCSRGEVHRAGIAAESEHRALGQSGQLEQVGPAHQAF
jgi:hypothetical protein